MLVKTIEILNKPIKQNNKIILFTTLLKFIKKPDYQLIGLF